MEAARLPIPRALRAPAPPPVLLLLAAACIALLVGCLVSNQFAEQTVVAAAGAVKIPRAVNLRPTMGTSRLFRPDFLKLEFPLQLRITHDLTAQRSASGRDHVNHGLHLLVRFNRLPSFAIFLLPANQKA